MESRSPVSANEHQSILSAATEAELAWHDVLLELEAGLDLATMPSADERAERTESDDATEEDAAGAPLAGSGMWRSPAQMPPLPDSLRARAEALHLAQMQREGELRAEQIQVQRQLEALSVVPRPRAAAASVYLDVVG